MFQYPSSLETEQAVIGVMLSDPKSHEIIFNSLTIDEFYDRGCRNLFIKARELYEREKPIDLITLSEYANTDIEKLADFATMGLPSMVPEYIRILREKNIRRQFIDAGRRIIELAAGDEIDDIVELKSEIISRVDIKVEDEKKYTDMPEIIDKVLTDIEKRMKNEDSRLKYGIPWLDRKTKGLWNGELVIIAARPSVGKTAFVSQIGVLNAFRKFKVVFFNLEMTKESMAERMLSNTSNVPGDFLRSPKQMMEKHWQQLGEAANELSKLNMFLIDDLYSIEEIEMRAKEIKAAKGLDLLIIDYLQLMEARRKFQSTNERVAYLSRKCKLMAKQLGIPVIVLSQLNRDGANREPILSDLRDSGAIEQDADVVIFLHNPRTGEYSEIDSNNDEIKIILAKQRNGETNVSKRIKYIRPISKFMEEEKC